MCHLTNDSGQKMRVKRSNYYISSDFEYADLFERFTLCFDISLQKRKYNYGLRLSNLLIDHGLQTPIVAPLVQLPHRWPHKSTDMVPKRLKVHFKTIILILFFITIVY